MSLILPGIGSNLVTGQAPFDSTLIGNSVFLNGSDEDINRTGFTLSSDGQKEFIISMWVNLCELGRAQQLFILGTSTGIASFNDDTQCTLNADNTIGFSVGTGGSSGGGITTTRVFRDIGWYHLLFTFNSNTSVSPATSRIQLYVNGELQTGSLTAVPDNQDVRGSLTGNVDLRFGKNTHPYLGYFYKGYYAQVCYLEGKSIQAGDFAVSDFLDTFTMGTNGSQFIPKKDSEIAALATTAGGNSACLDFSDSSDLGNDISDNNKDFTATNMGSANQTLHTPSLSYPIFNMLSPTFTGAGTWSEGNTKIVATTESTEAITTLPPISTGKYYYQWVFTDNASSGNCSSGMTPISNWNGKGFSEFASGDIFYADHRNQVFRKGSTTISSILGSSGTYALCFDLDAGKVWVGLVDTSDGSISWYDSSGGTTGDPANGNNPTATFTANTPMVPFTTMGKAAGTSWTMDWNFGQFGFGNSAVPTGFEQITSAKVAAPDKQGVDYFQPVTYTGNGTAIGSGGKAVTGTGFKADWVWIKNRDADDDHALYDIARGVTKQLESNTGAAESTQTEGLTTFGSDGFTVGSLDQVNTNTENFISWNWLASNSTSTTSPAGTIASTSSVASAGHFSVGTYTGQTDAGTVGHGLGGVAEMVIVWDKGFTNSIAVYHVGVASDAETDYLLLSQADAATDNATFWNDTAPTSEVFSVGTGNNTNGNGRAKSFLAFRSVPGVCKVGSYIGNSDADGTYVPLGFKPRYFMVKNSDATQDWRIYDTVIEPINPNDQFFKANENNSQISSSGFDFLSDGVKARDDNAGFNSAATFIYLAMADIGGNGTLPPIYGR